MDRKKRRGQRSLKEWADGLRSEVDPEVIRRALVKRAVEIDVLCERYGLKRGEVLRISKKLISEGYNVQRFGESLQILKGHLPNTYDASRHKVVSDSKGCYRFGLIADTHLGSKYQRLDVCEDLYDWFAAEGIKKVYHAGNWVDGEFRFNKFDLLPEAHGMQSQLDYFVEYYPQRKGITTYYVTGDDHEGWWCQREGVDIGRMLEQTANDVGRKDLKHLGYIESFITLQHKKTGNTAKLFIQHPGGGSAYAISYALQKIIEAFQSGEKPAVAAFGHYHKQGYFIVRGVHSILVPCTKDLDTFGRKKRLTYVVGGLIVELKQDEQGGISECTPRFKLYFDRSYYNYQFNMAGPIRKRRAPHGARRNKRGAEDPETLGA